MAGKKTKHVPGLEQNYPVVLFVCLPEGFIIANLCPITWPPPVCTNQQHVDMICSFILPSCYSTYIYIHTLYITYIYNIEVPHQILPAILSNRCLRVLPPLPHHVLWKPMPSAPPVITMFKKVGWLLTIPRKMGGKHDIVLTTWYIQIPLKSSFLLIRYH